MNGIGFASYGKVVTVSTAMTVGSNFLATVGVMGVNSSDLTLSYTATTQVNGAAVNNFYVFNITGRKGFVMVSADDKVIPVLAYSNESSFDINKISPSTTFWIGGYQKQISAAIAADVTAKPGTTQRWNELETGTGSSSTARTTSSGVTPLLSTTWDQSAYFGPATYNEYCPNTALSGGLSVTGCVATAMAQVMKFWSWPSVGTGSHTYTDPTSGATLTANYSATPYQWSLMPAMLTPASSSAQINAVATLMLQAGISVDMSYSASGSGSYVLSLESYGINCAQYALPTYFHYKPTLQGIPRFGEVPGYGDPIVDSIAEATWISMLQAELNAGRPMLYDGEEPADAGGHCWVLDGWESTSSVMFHFNWGWSGLSDGYYTVDNLDPSGLGGSNLNLDQGIIMGIEPDSFPSAPGNLELLAPLNANVSSPMPYASPFAITTKILNTDTTAYMGDFCARVYNANNTLVCTIATITNDTIAAGDSSALLTFSTTGIDSMVPYLYSIQVLYRATGTTTWIPVANNGNYINYTMLGIDNDTDVVLYDSIIVGSHSFPSGSPLTVTANIADQSSTYTVFEGTLQAVMINVTTGTSYTVKQLTDQTVDTNAFGNTFTFYNSDMSIPVGLYALTIEHQYNGTGSFHVTSSDYYSNPVLMNVTAYTNAPTVASADNVYVYPNPAKDVVTIATQGAGIKEVNVMDVAGHVVHTATTANQSLVSVPIADLATGVYMVQVQTAIGTVTKKLVVTR